MMQLPFSLQNVREQLVGRELILCSNLITQNSYYYSSAFTLKEDGTTNIGLKWNVENDALRILSKTGQLLYSFAGIESKNGSLYAVGCEHLQVNSRSYHRVTLHLASAITANKTFCIGISTHKNYYEKTVPKLVKSLLKQGFPASNIFPVAGGFDKKGIITLNDTTITCIPGNWHGFTVLQVFPAGFDYMLLMHDTTEVMDGFPEAVYGTDMGINWDISLAVENIEMGFYSADFVKRLTDDIWKLPKHLRFEAILQQARMFAVYGSTLTALGNRDVYGNGVRRTITEISGLGLKKYQKAAKQDATNLP